MDIVVKLVVAGFAVAAVWMLLQPRCAFVVRVQDGRAEAVRGKVTAAFLDLVADVCREFGVSSATIRGAVRGRRISLLFSWSVPPPARQRMRNWWAVSGWPAPPNSP